MDKDFIIFGSQKFDEECVSDAPDPTDIIWENRHFTKGQIFKRSAIVFTLCIALLVLTFFALM
jgi:hypothetical protein